MRLFYTILAVVCIWACPLAQSTLLQYNFEGATAYPISPNATATGITCTASSTETFTVFGGTNTGAAAFASDNSSVTTALGMNNSSGTNTRYFQFQLGGANLSCYKCYKIYFQAQRSGTGATTITLQYSTDGTTYTSFGTTASPGNGSYVECSLDLCSTTALDNQSAVYFRLCASGASGTGTLRLDNFQVQAKSIITDNLSASSFTTDCSTPATTTISYTAQCANAGNVFSVYLSDASGNFSSPTTIGTFTSTATTGTISVTIPVTIPTGSSYAMQIVSSNPSITGTSSSTFTVTSACNVCPSLTGVILDACNTSCNEGDGEVMLMNTGSYSVSVASLPAHLINYYGSTANFTSGTINNYTGTFSSNATATSSLNSGAGCSGAFIDAAAAGSIPAGATVMLLPNTFNSCAANYDFSNLCASFNPIYVLYFATSGTGNWSSFGNLQNHSATNPSPNYLQLNLSAFNSNCASQYYNFDAFGEANGNGAGAAFPGTSNNNPSAQTSPASYTSASCTLPIVLPVNLLEFKAERYSGSLARVGFTTASETSVSIYKISKSYDGSSYVTLSEFTAHNEAGQFHYSSFDDIADHDQPVIYYRLLEITVDGQEKIIANCALEVRAPSETWIYSYGNEVIIRSPAGILHAEVYTAAGSRVMTFDGLGDKTSYHFETTALPQGMYFVSVTDAIGKTVVKKIIR